MARHTLINRLACITAAAGTAMLLVIVSAGASTAQEAGATNTPASSVRFSPSGPSSGHSLTRLVETGVQTPAQDPNRATKIASEHSLTRLVETGVQTPAPHPNHAIKIASGHSLTRLVETGIQTPSPPFVHRAVLGREGHATVIEVRPVALGALGGLVLTGACTLALRRRRTLHVA
jgi:hypothetical protein